MIFIQITIEYLLFRFSIKEKKRCFKDWQRDRSLESYEFYKQAKRLSSKAVGEAKKKAYHDLYNRLGTKKKGRRISIAC